MGCSRRLRKAKANYDSAKDPDLRKPAPVTPATPGTVAAFFEKYWPVEVFVGLLVLAMISYHVYEERKK